MVQAHHLEVGLIPFTEDEFFLAFPVGQNGHKTVRDKDVLQNKVTDGQAALLQYVLVPHFLGTREIVLVNHSRDAKVPEKVGKRDVVGVAAQGL